jgi:type II secretory pathway component PulF
MTLYRCLVITREGRTEQRSIDATSRQGAVAVLVADGLVPVEVRDSAPSLVERLNQPLTLGTGLRVGEQSLILTQLAMLIRSGLPVDRSLDLLREQAPRAQQRDILAHMLARVRAGSSLAAALEDRGSFPNYVVGVVRSAERGGRLGDALTAVAERLTLVAATRRQLATALTYPAAVLAATLIALSLVLTMVVPQFEPIFSGEEARLPILTQGVLALSRLVNDHLPLFVLGLVVPPLLLWLLLRSHAGQDALTRHRRRIPGMLLRDQYLAAQFTGILGTLIGNGVSVVAALPLARGAIGSRRWQRHLQQVEQHVREGVRLSSALARDALLPSTAIRLIEVGERSGQLAETSLQASMIIGEGARSKLDRIVALANPIAIISLGGLVAMLVAGVMLGIFAMGDFAG